MDPTVVRKGWFNGAGSNKRQLRVAVGLCCIAVMMASPAALNLSAELLQKVKAKYGVQASERLNSWQVLVEMSKNLPEKDKLIQVNNFFNQQVEFVNDEYLWGINDYWATPLEMLAKGAGDCEDYSIAKYFTLRELGVPDSKMRLTYVKALELNQAHMVLTFFDTPRSVPLVLDNLIPSIKSATNRRDLLPVYSFNGTGLWLAKTRGEGKLIGGSSRLKMWEQLKSRILSNQF
ncbi:MAG: sulfate adenylyltransferase [Cycloclasticus sp.]|nr:MAG: sulfate adenylyltransferase [Cycloclasticus sp.]